MWVVVGLMAACSTAPQEGDPDVGEADVGENQVGEPDAFEPEDEHEWVTEAVDVPRVEHRTFFSEAIGQEVSYHVFVPMPYENLPDERFPVVYWLHGSGGGLPGIAPVTQHFAQAMQAGDIPVMLVVFPNGLPHGMWVNWKDGSVPMETIVIDELVPHIDQTFRTIADREGRIVEGFSMGGYGAARFGFKFPELFGAVSMLGAGPLQPELTTHPRVDEERRDQVMSDTYGDDMDYFREVSPWVLAEENADALKEGTRIRLAIGELDGTYEFNEAFHGRLTDLEIPHEYFVVPEVGHAPLPLMEGVGDALWGFYDVEE